MRGRLQLLGFALFLVVGCTILPPTREYTLARTALDSARRVEAIRVAPAFFHKAEEAYRKAEMEYKKENYAEAKDYFLTAQDYAEKAENSTRLQK